MFTQAAASLSTCRSGTCYVIVNSAGKELRKTETVCVISILTEMEAAHA